MVGINTFVRLINDSDIQPNLAHFTVSTDVKHGIGDKGGLCLVFAVRANGIGTGIMYEPSLEFRIEGKSSEGYSWRYMYRLTLSNTGIFPRGASEVNERASPNYWSIPNYGYEFYSSDKDITKWNGYNYLMMDPQNNIVTDKTYFTCWAEKLNLLPEYLFATDTSIKNNQWYLFDLHFVGPQHNHIGINGFRNSTGFAPTDERLFTRTMPTDIPLNTVSFTLNTATPIPFDDKRISFDFSDIWITSKKIDFYHENAFFNQFLNMDNGFVHNMSDRIALIQGNYEVKPLFYLPFINGFRNEADGNDFTISSTQTGRVLLQQQNDPIKVYDEPQAGYHNVITCGYDPNFITEGYMIDDTECVHCAFEVKNSNILLYSLWNKNNLKNDFAYITDSVVLYIRYNIVQINPTDKQIFFIIQYDPFDVNDNSITIGKIIEFDLSNYNVDEWYHFTLYVDVNILRNSDNGALLTSNGIDVIVPTNITDVNWDMSGNAYRSNLMFGSISPINMYDQSPGIINGSGVLYPIIFFEKTIISNTQYPWHNPLLMHWYFENQSDGTPINPGLNGSGALGIQPDFYLTGDNGLNMYGNAANNMKCLAATGSNRPSTQYYTYKANNIVNSQHARYKK